MEKEIEIVEKYFTINGEAPFSGCPVFLIRFSSCNLDCLYCDTKYRKEVNERPSLYELEKEIRSIVDDYPGILVLLTGGEPLLNERRALVIELVKNNPGIKFCVETNGSIDIRGLQFPNCFLVLDWKTPSSGFKNSFIEKNLDFMIPGKDCIKFVAASSDFSFVKKRIMKIKKTNPSIKTYISPQWGNVSLEELSNFILKNKLDVSLSLQYHKIIWGASKRGV